MRTAGFGAEVEAALNRRRQWLLDQGFARDVDGKVAYARNLLATLQRRELARAGARLAQETGLDYVETVRGEEVRGAYRRSTQVAASPSSSTRVNSRSFPGGRRWSAPGGGASAESSAIRDSRSRSPSGAVSGFEACEHSFLLSRMPQTTYPPAD